MKTIAALLMLACSSAYGLTIQVLNIPGDGATAYALNDKGQIVGTYLPDFGFLWENGGTTTLFDMLPYAINNDGIIVGIGYSDFSPLISDPNTGISTHITVPSCGPNFNGSAVAISDSGYFTGQTCGQAFRYKIGRS